MARDKIKRNVVVLCPSPLARRAPLEVPDARPPLHAYIVMSLLTGARTEELRALRWEDVELSGQPEANPPVPAHVAVWRSVRKGGDTKTRKSRRTLAPHEQCIDALIEKHARQQRDRADAGDRWREHGLVLVTKVGTPLDPSHMRCTESRSGQSCS